MRPVVSTSAHQTDRCAELVCSNSFRSDNPRNAVGLLKREMEALDSLVIALREAAAVPAGDALAMDRHGFAVSSPKALARGPRSRSSGTRFARFPRRDSRPRDGAADLAGPRPRRSESSSAPRTSTSTTRWRRSSKPRRSTSRRCTRCRATEREAATTTGTVPLDKEEYEAFVAQLLSAEIVPVKDFEKGIYFEGCLPIEVMAERGVETLRHGPMKPMGLPDPRTGGIPWAVVQLRQDDSRRSTTTWSASRRS
jgi:methylenetetrahydrofolate--tRNA-(uracil-5-)-methyltransferase